MKIFEGLKANSEQSRGLIFSIALTALILIVEVVAGFLTNSLALLSDAAHVFTDLFSLGLALFAIMLSGLPSSDTRTYGWHRSEVFAAFANGATLILISGMILYEAILRLMSPEEVHSLGMMVAAIFGLVINLAVVHRLQGHDHHDLNMRSAFLHVVGDALISLGVIIGGIIIYYTGWYAVDPILSIIFSLVILRGAAKILYESAHILFEGVPKGMDINAVVAEILKVEHVVEVHRLHVWSICSNITALSAHVLIDADLHEKSKKVIDDINCKLMSCFQINHSTIQLEVGECEFSNLVCDIAHCDRNAHNHNHDHDHGHDHEHEHEEEHAHAH